jgi:uncharacterized SAM-binding protein YcdF (DUF218 family)
MIRSIILSIATILLLWGGGYLYYAHYTTLYSIDKSTITNAIAVFTGGRQRINTGIGLLKAGYAPILFISGVESKNQLKNFLLENSIKQDQVIYGNATTTEENAKEIAEFISNHDISSIRLVTSSYHMPRALLEVERFIPLNSRVTIIPHPVFSEYQNYSVLFKEYNKYLVIVISKFFQ